MLVTIELKGLSSVLVETGQFIEAKASGQSFEPFKAPRMISIKFLLIISAYWL